MSYASCPYLSLFQFPFSSPTFKLYCYPSFQILLSPLLLLSSILLSPCFNLYSHLPFSISFSFPSSSNYYLLTLFAFLSFWISMLGSSFLKSYSQLTLFQYLLSANILLLLSIILSQSFHFSFHLPLHLLSSILIFLWLFLLLFLSLKPHVLCLMSLYLPFSISI
jgi:hypothetical protein